VIGTPVPSRKLPAPVVPMVLRPHNDRH
jgi:hypothetical protein